MPTWNNNFGKTQLQDVGGAKEIIRILYFFKEAKTTGTL